MVAPCDGLIVLLQHEHGGHLPQHEIITSRAEQTGGRLEETRLAVKYVVTLHISFFEKGPILIIIINPFNCCEETFWANYQSHFSFPVYFQKF